MARILRSGARAVLSPRYRCVTFFVARCGSACFGDAAMRDDEA